MTFHMVPLRKFQVFPGLRYKLSKCTEIQPPHIYYEMALISALTLNKIFPNWDDDLFLIPGNSPISAASNDMLAKLLAPIGPEKTCIKVEIFT